MTTSSGVVLWNTLGSREEVTNSEVGPDGIYVGGGEFVPGVFGDAFSVAPSEDFRILFPAEEIHSLTEGTIEFWAKLENPPTFLWSVNRPDFFVPVKGDGPRIGLNGNNGRGQGGLVGSGNNKDDTGSDSSWRISTYEQVLGPNVEDWHHYAVAWDNGGLPGLGETVALFLDGAMVSTVWWNYEDEPWLTQPPFVRGEFYGVISNFNNEFDWSQRVVIDNLRIFDYARTDFNDRFIEDPITIDPPDPTTGADFIVMAEPGEIRALWGDDTVLGSNGEDVIFGQGGNDFLLGGGGNDLLRGGGGDDTLKGSGGDDTLRGGAGDDMLNGGSGDDMLNGGSGDDKLSGSIGDDKLSGSIGDDTLSGGSGDDTLSGGDGADTFVFNAGSTGDTLILDFEVGIDNLHLTNVTGTGIAMVGNDAVVELDNGGTIAFRDVDAVDVADLFVASPVPNGWVQWSTDAGGNGHWYNIVSAPDGISWDEANTCANGMAGGSAHLATLTSPAENSFVFDNLVDDFAYWSPVGHGPWFGLVQDPASAEPGEGWGWVTGEAFAFENWERGEPNNITQNNEDGGHFAGLGFSNPVDVWNDAWMGDDGPIAYVVEVASVDFFS